MAKGNEGREAAESAGGCLICVLAVAVSAVLSGWAGMTLWGWFVVPLGLPEVSLWHAAGLCLVARLLAGYRSGGAEDDSPPLQKSLHSLAVAVLFPLLTVGLGWCVKAFMG